MQARHLFGDHAGRCDACAAGSSAAVAALRKLKGTYIARHAERIAHAALCAADEAAATAAVLALVGHTTVGRNHAQRWARIARKAADYRAEDADNQAIQALSIGCRTDDDP